MEAKSRWTALVEGVISEHAGAVLGGAGRPTAVAGAFQPELRTLEAGIAVQPRFTQRPGPMACDRRRALPCTPRMGDEAYHLDQAALAQCATWPRRRG